VVIRKGLYRALFPAAVVLPVWLLVGWGVFGTSAWSFLGLLVICPVLFIALGLVSGIVYARPSVRLEKAVSWRDVAFFAAWYATIIGFGFFGPLAPWFAVAGILVGLGAFWSSISALVADAARQMRSNFAEYQPGSGPAAARQNPLPPLDGGEYIVIRDTHK
jgi:hypothetical protein